MSDDKVIGAFSEADAARLSGLSLGQLRSWDRKQFLHPSYAEADRRLPYSRIYSFRDIVSLRVLGQLRNIHKVPLQHLREVSNHLSEFGDARWTAAILYVLGKKVVYDEPSTEQRKEVVSGQRVLDIPLRVAISETRSAIENLNVRAVTAVGQVVHGRFTLQNEPVFEGTRIPVATIKRYLEAKYSSDAIIQEFPGITIADIMAAETYSEGQKTT